MATIVRRIRIATATHRGATSHANPRKGYCGNCPAHSWALSYCTLRRMFVCPRCTVDA